MTDVVRINATLSPALLERVDDYAARMMEDRSTAVRQLLDRGLRALVEDESVAAYRAGRLTLRELAAALHLDTYQAQDVLSSRGAAVATGRREDTAADLRDLITELRGR